MHNKLFHTYTLYNTDGDLKPFSLRKGNDTFVGQVYLYGNINGQGAMVDTTDLANNNITHSGTAFQANEDNTEIQWCTGVIEIDEGGEVYKYGSLIELNAGTPMDRTVKNIYISEADDFCSTVVTERVSQLVVQDIDGEPELFEVFDTDVDSALRFRHIRFKLLLEASITGDLVRGNSILLGSIGVFDPDTNYVSGNLIRGNSSLSGDIDIYYVLAISGNLIRGNSELSGTVSITLVKHYLIQLFSNVSKTNAILESLRFEADINGVKFPLIGFAIRSTLIKTDTEISNIAELKLYMSDEDIVTYNGLIGTAVLMINSIYNFGSTSTETTLFSGILDDLTKRTLSNFIVAKASNQKSVSGISTVTPGQIVLLSGSMSRLAFDPTVQPNDHIKIDGSTRIARRVTHYNYINYNAYTEVYYG